MPNKIVAKIKDAGVVGAGGAGFPTHIKVDSEVQIVLGNGASCEPLLMSDIYLMEKMPNLIFKGIQLVMESSGAKEGILCLKAKHDAAWKSLEEVRKRDFPGLEMFELGDFYPAGDEQVLVYEVTGKVVPEGGIPLEVGVIVSNVETLLNIERAVGEGTPVTRRYLTVTGEVQRPNITSVPIGVPISQVIDHAGGALIDDFLVVIGGPMMGIVTSDLSMPITKTTSAIIVLPKEHNVVQTRIRDPKKVWNITKTVCCQCSRCTDLCPRHLLGHRLEPHRIMRALGWSANLPQEVLEDVLICSECGICEKYACPMMISPREVNAQIKKELASRGVKRKSKENQYRPSEFRDVRKVPTQRLMERLDITKYDTHPSFKEFSENIKEVKIPLKQHIGDPARPLVREGDRVKEGDLIGDIPDKVVGAKVHSSINGVVTFVGEYVTIEVVNR